jgi:hypothetical protein
MRASLPCALIGGAVVPILLGGTVVEAIAIAIGILLGFVIAARVFGHGGVDVWLTPILCAWLLTIGATKVLQTGQLSTKSIALLGTKSFIALVVGQFAALYLYKALDRIKKK